MNKKCDGCGYILQSHDKTKNGYVRDSVIEKALLCERCFKIKHYGENYVINFNYDYDAMIQKIKNKKLIYVIDVLNICASNLEYLKYIKSTDLVVITKRDVLPKSVKDKKIKKFFLENFKSDVNTIVVSSKSKHNIDELFNMLKGEYYIIGLTNSGKSSLINAILESVGKSPTITTSNVPNTTLEFIKLKINDDVTIIDTPGFVNKNAIYEYISVSDIKKLASKSAIKPVIMQTKPGFTVLVDNFVRIDNISEVTVSLCFYMSNDLKISKMKIDTRSDLKSLPKKVIQVNGCEDIVINGLGFIKVTKPCRLVVYTLDEELISIRPRMI